MGVGSVYITKDDRNAALFNVRNIQHIIDFILSIYDNFPLLTSKHLNSLNFKKALLITTDTTLTKKEKNIIISLVKSKDKPMGYISLVK